MPVLSCSSYDVQRHEANWHDHLDCDYVDYYRFGRVGEQLASTKKFPTHCQKRTWRWVFYFGHFQRRSCGTP
jgi:hypothetical protein